MCWIVVQLAVHTWLVLAGVAMLPCCILPLHFIASSETKHGKRKLRYSLYFYVGHLNVETYHGS